MIDVLLMARKAIDVSRDTWFRMKTGTYKTDLAREESEVMETNLILLACLLKVNEASQSSSQQKNYKTRFTAVLDCIRFLLMQELLSRGHDELKESLNKENLIELLNWYAARRKKINEVLFNNAPGNDQMTSPSIHKDLVNCCEVETTMSMINEMDDSLFSILVDESRDNSIKEQMTVVLRFVDKSVQVKERLLGICHIADTCAQSLKDVVDAIFSTHGLSISSLRGQGYDGASNMSGEFNDLKALILRESTCAMYIHCFAHQLQLTVVFVAHRNVMLSDLFNMLAIIVNLVGASCKRVDAFQTSYHFEILEMLNIEELSSGTSQFQEMSLARPGVTRWGSHLKTVTHFIIMFNAIIDVLENISEDNISFQQKSMAIRQMNTMQDFQFVSSLHFMFEIL
ncbi:zinc finger MYM-type protein 1-like, partial [Olea europaea var. sylvestris]|uniref:zinc finger MYM-type protein 1-like n=1 Tax=Olea europaea var. sylvestris TaxID=158386 RepID=UPI000C1CCCEB